jgi:hypothetical protein
MVMFGIVGAVLVALFVAPLFGRDRPIARY